MDNTCSYQKKSRNSLAAAECGGLAAAWFEISGALPINGT